MYIIARVVNEGINLSFNGAHSIVFVKEVRGSWIELGVIGDLDVRVKPVDDIKAVLPPTLGANAHAGLKRARKRKPRRRTKE